MKKLTLLISLIAVFGLGLLAPAQVSAVDLTVTCADQGSCSTSPSSGAALFEENNFLPGDSVSRQITVVNEDENDSCDLTMDTRDETQTPGDFATKLLTVIKQGTTDLFNNSLNNLFEAGPVSLGIVGTGSTNVYSWVVTFDLNSGNQYQRAETKFDFDLSFECGLAPTPTPTPTPSGGGTVAGVSVGGGDVSAPACTDAKPGIPTGLTAATGPGAGQVTLSWTPPSPPYTYFLVAYSDSPSWPPKWGNPSVGNVNTYTVSGLGSGTYWFWVRAGNGCMPGDFAGPVSPGAITGVPGAPVAVGFLPGVLGEATPSGQIQGGETVGEVAGAGEGVCQECLWWPVLLGELIALVIFYWLVLQKYGSGGNYLLSTLIPLVTYLIFLVLNKDCLSDSFFCRYFWLLDIVLFVIFLGLVRSWKKAE